jgi:hypothetical protein
MQVIASYLSDLRRLTSKEADETSNTSDLMRVVEFDRYQNSKKQNPLTVATASPSTRFCWWQKLAAATAAVKAAAVIPNRRNFTITVRSRRTSHRL